MGRDDQGAQESAARYQWVPRTLSFLTRGDKVLLLKGAPTRRIWPGKYNGVGGHVERHEDVLSAALREIHEETGLRPRSLQLCGIVNVDAGDQRGIGLFVFKGEAEGELTSASAEGDLEWVPAEKALSLDLVEDLPTLLPKVLARDSTAAPFFAHYWYDGDDRLQMTFFDAASVPHPPQGHPA